MPRPRKAVAERQATPIQVRNQPPEPVITPKVEPVAATVAERQVTVEQFMAAWNDLYRYFEGGTLLDASKKKLVRAVLSRLSILKE